MQKKVKTPQIFTGHFLYVAGILIFCLIIVSIWFRDGKLLATGEEGLILYNPQRAVELYKYSWAELGTGYAEPSFSPRIPFLNFVSYLNDAGIEMWIVQAALFFILILTGMTSVYLLVSQFLSDDSKYEKYGYIPLVSAIFYILNPVSLLGIWYRFILMFMFFFALAPLFLLIFVVGLKKRNIFYVLFLSIVTFIFSYAFASPSMAPLLWILPAIYTFCSIFIKRKGERSKVFPLLYLIVGITLWFVTSLWWIVPYIKLSQYSYSSETDIAHAIGTLKANSKDFSLFNVLRLTHGGFLYRAEVFGKIYKSLPFLILSWITPFLAIVGLKTYKNSFNNKYLLISFLLLIFLSMGTSPPFGFVFLWLFKYIPVMQLFRNPLEKFGLLLPIVYAPLFALGSFYIIQKIKSRSGKLICWVSIISTLLITNWPFFTGAMAKFEERDIRVQVPSVYNTTNNVLNDKDHRILSLPLMGGSSGFYNWDFGFSGIDGSEYLFSKPVISKTYLPYTFFGQMIVGVSAGAVQNNLIGLAQLLSADIIAHRKDLDIPKYGSYQNANEVVQKMLSSAKLESIFTSPYVDLWKVPVSDLQPIIYPADKINYVNLPEEILIQLNEKTFNPLLEVFVCREGKYCLINSSKNLNIFENLVKPKAFTFTKIDPTRYQVVVKESTGNFILVLSQTYHPRWEAYVDGVKVSDEKHFEVNGFANGFLIDKKRDFEIALKFEIN